MHIAFLSNWRYTHTMSWALLLSTLIVAIAATIARATLNLKGALMAEDGTLAVYLLLPDDEVSDVTLLRAGYEGTEEKQEFLIETKDGPKLIRLLKGPEGWRVKGDAVTLRASK